MNTGARYLLLVLGIIISLHYILSFSHEEYGKATSISHIASHFRGGSAAEKFPVPEDYYTKANSSSSLASVNATFVILARNSDLNGIIKSVRDVEDRFNHAYNYPYVFLNEEPFTPEFQKRIQVLSRAKMEFGVIPRDHWYQPDSIDETKASASRKKMEEDHIIYGGSVSYRNMCRFNSGFFFRHELLQKYKWYWRVEPDIHFHCDIRFDPFKFMEDKKKVYGFTITMYEYEATIPTLWGHVKDFVRDHPEYIAENNAMNFMSEDNGVTYNKCHFWSNFEIADLDFWRSPAYTAFFDYLDSKGGFYYERWGDAPVHSIAAALFIPKEQIHFFDDFGYEHNPYTSCTMSDERWAEGRCACDPKRSFNYDGYSCMSKWDRLMEG